MGDEHVLNAALLMAGCHGDIYTKVYTFPNNLLSLITAIV